MNKRDLVARISDDTRLMQKDVGLVIQGLLEVLKESLAKGDRVEIRNFGVFEVVTRQTQIGCNPRNPATKVIIPAHTRVRFPNGKKLQEQVLPLTQRLGAPEENA